MALLTSVLKAATRARARLFSAACQLHWRMYGDHTDLLIEVDDSEGVDCNVNCEAVGGPDHCMCIVQEEPYQIEYTDPDVVANYPEVDAENGMRYRYAKKPGVTTVHREYAEILF